MCRYIEKFLFATPIQQISFKKKSFQKGALILFTDTRHSFPVSGILILHCENYILKFISNTPFMIGHLTEKEIEEVLKNNSLGRIGCRNGIKPYVIPIKYVYDGKFVIAHSQMGHKINMMRQYPYICFQIDEIKDYTHWRSVMVWGTYQEMTEERDRSYATKLFSQHQLHIKVNDHPTINENKRPVIYRIVIDEKHGRFEME